MPIPALLDGWSRFKAGRFQDQRSLFERLRREGQRPLTAMVACCDSRVDPAIVFDCDPGDLFVIRNVANLVPPCEEDGAYHGTSAAIEFAVAMLKVQHLVVFGHAECGGISALLGASPLPNGLRFVTPWIRLAEEAREAAFAADLPFAERQAQCEQLSVRLSVRNLRSFPVVQEAVAAGRLDVHGMHFDFRDCALRILTPDGRFVPAR
jgi:carbonic anhydrase